MAASTLHAPTNPPIAAPRTPDAADLIAAATSLPSPPPSSSSSRRQPKLPSVLKLAKGSTRKGTEHGSERTAAAAGMARTLQDVNAAQDITGDDTSTAVSDDASQLPNSDSAASYFPSTDTLAASTYSTAGDRLFPSAATPGIDASSAISTPASFTAAVRGTLGPPRRSPPLGRAQDSPSTNGWNTPGTGAGWNTPGSSVAADSPRLPPARVGAAPVTPSQLSETTKVDSPSASHDPLPAVSHMSQDSLTSTPDDAIPNANSHILDSSLPENMEDPIPDSPPATPKGVRGKKGHPKASNAQAAPETPATPSAKDSGASRPTEARAPFRTPSMDSTLSSISSTPSQSSTQDLTSPSDAEIAQMIAVAGSTEELVRQLTREKKATTAQNAQLWRLINKQRTLVMALKSDLERNTQQREEDREKYRRRLKESGALSGFSTPSRLDTGVMPSPVAPFPPASIAKALGSSPAGNASEDEKSTVSGTATVTKTLPANAYVGLPSPADSSSAVSERAPASFPPASPAPASLPAAPSSAPVSAVASTPVATKSSWTASTSDEKPRRNTVIRSSFKPIALDFQQTQTIDIESMFSPDSPFRDTDPANSPTSFSARRSMAKPLQDPSAAAGATSSDPKSPSTTSARKGPPAPLNLDLYASSSQLGGSFKSRRETDPDEPLSARGRKKTREEDDLEREKWYVKGSPQSGLSSLGDTTPQYPRPPQTLPFTPASPNAGNAGTTLKPTKYDHEYIKAASPPPQYGLPNAPIRRGDPSSRNGSTDDGSEVTDGQGQTSSTAVRGHQGSTAGRDGLLAPPKSLAGVLSEHDHASDASDAASTAQNSARARSPGLPSSPRPSDRATLSSPQPGPRAPREGHLVSPPPAISLPALPPSGSGPRPSVDTASIYSTPSAGRPSLDAGPQPTESSEAEMPRSSSRQANFSRPTGDGASISYQEGVEAKDFASSMPEPTPDLADFAFFEKPAQQDQEDASHGTSSDFNRGSDRTGGPVSRKDSAASPKTDVHQFDRTSSSKAAQTVDESIIEETSAKPSRGTPSSEAAPARKAERSPSPESEPDTPSLARDDPDLMPLAERLPAKLLSRRDPSLMRAGDGSADDNGGIYRGLVCQSHPKLLLSPPALGSIVIKVASSRLRPARHSILSLREDNPVFTLGVSRRADGKQLWRNEKAISSLQALHQQLVGSHRLDIKMPDKTLFQGSSPAKVDARREALNRYFEELLHINMSEAAGTCICEFLTHSALPVEDQEIIRAQVIEGERKVSVNPDGTLVKEGYLTKRGKNFGGWKSRFFMLDEPILRYYESPGGPLLGTIRLSSAQIGRQSVRQPSESPSRIDDPDSEYRHAFLILEPKRNNSKHLIRHVLCAENDVERDEWVQALLTYVGKDTLEPKSGKSKLKKGREDSPLREIEAASFESLQGVSYEETAPGQPVKLAKGQTPSQTSSPSSPNFPLNTTAAAALSASASTSSSAPTVASGATSASSSTPRNISGPVNGAIIHDAGAWGNKAADGSKATTGSSTNAASNASSNATPPLVKKRSIWGFRDKDKGLGDNTGIAASSSSGPPPQISAPGPGPTAPKTYAARPIFGMPLTEAVESYRARGSDEPLPSVVFRCLQYLEHHHAENEEGLFRQSGSNVTIRQLRDRFNAEGDLDFLAEGVYYDVHAVASLLKWYLRDLPDMILTREMHLEFLKVLEVDDAARRTQLFRQLIPRLPSSNQTLLRRVTAFLTTIVEHEHLNKMGVRNVGIVFSPTLNIPAPILATFILEHDPIFGSDLLRTTSHGSELLRTTSYGSDMLRTTSHDPERSVRTPQPSGSTSPYVSHDYNPYDGPHALSTPDNSRLGHHQQKASDTSASSVQLDSFPRTGGYNPPPAAPSASASVFSSAGPAPPSNGPLLPATAFPGGPRRESSASSRDQGSGYAPMGTTYDSRGPASAATQGAFSRKTSASSAAGYGMGGSSSGGAYSPHGGSTRQHSQSRGQSSRTRESFSGSSPGSGSPAMGQQPGPPPTTSAAMPPVHGSQYSSSSHSHSHHGSQQRMSAMPSFPSSSSTPQSPHMPTSPSLGRMPMPPSPSMNSVYDKSRQASVDSVGSMAPDRRTKAKRRESAVLPTDPAMALLGLGMRKGSAASQRNRP